MNLLKIGIVISVSIHFCFGQADLNIKTRVVSKDTIYIDEDNKIINSEIFKDKILSEYYYANLYETDENFYGKLQWTHFIGKLNQLQKAQLFQELKIKHQVDTSKVMVIHYLDTLKSKTELKRSTYYEENRNQHINHETYPEQHQQCLKKFKKRQNTNVYHFYNYQNNHQTTIKNLIWHQDSNKRFKSFFKKNNEISHTIIILPDGYYLIHYRFFWKYNIEIHEIFIKYSEFRTKLIKSFNKEISLLNFYKLEADNMTN